MGRFDRRASNKMRRRKAQTKKKARAKKVAVATKTERHAKPATGGKKKAASAG